MTNPDPFEMLETNVPFTADVSSDPEAANKKASTYKEVIMRTESLTLTESTSTFNTTDRPSPEPPHRPKHASRSATRTRQLVNRAVVGAALIVTAIVGATLVPLGGDTGIAVAAAAADKTAQATSGEVTVDTTRTTDDGIVSESRTFTFDGADAAVSSDYGSDARLVDGIGYLNQNEWFSSPLHDRDRLFGTFAANLATTDGLNGLLELSEETTSAMRDDGTEVITAEIRVDAGPGQSFDSTGFDNLPAGLLISPQGNFDLIVTVEVTDELIASIAWTAVGTRHEPSPFDAEGDPVSTRNFRDTGTITYSGINEPQVIEAPQAATPATGVDEWKLLDGITRTGMGNLFTTQQLNPGVCGIDTLNLNLLVEPLTPASTAVFTDLIECLDSADEFSAARSVETLIAHRR